MREKLVTCHDTLSERNEAPIVTVLNKVDRVDEADLERTREALRALAPNPLAVSGLTGENVDALRDRIADELPDWRHERLVLPITDEAMSLVSWIHDNGAVADESYADGQVVVEFEARPAVVERARARAGELTPVP
jgi:GTP-binding protein HflX